MEAYVGHIGIFHATLVNGASTSKDTLMRGFEIDQEWLKSIINC